MRKCQYILTKIFVKTDHNSTILSQTLSQIQKQQRISKIKIKNII